MTVRKPFFVEPLALGTIASGNETAGFPAANLGRIKAPALVWRSTGNADLWARGSMTSSQEIDFASVISANAQPGTTIRLRLGNTQAEVDGAGVYDSGPLTFNSPYINRWDQLFHSHHELPSLIGASWWRIDIGGHTGDFEAMALILGRRVEPSRFYNFDYEMGVEDTGKGEWTQSGVYDEQEGVRLRTVAFQLDWQTEQEYEEKFRPMTERNGATGFVYLCFDPEASAYRHQRTYLGTMKKPGYATGRRRPTLRAQEFEVHSII